MFTLSWSRSIIIDFTWRNFKALSSGDFEWLNTNTNSSYGVAMYALYWSRRQFDGDIYSLWTYDVNGMATNSNSRVYLLLGVASVLLFYGRGVRT